jgi:SAM-dependent methyltransferase
VADHRDADPSFGTSWILVPPGAVTCQMRQSEHVVDALFAHQRLAQLYDFFDADRRDLDLYLAMVEEFGAGRVLDIGCGTGTLACLLALRGMSVVGIDPAAASLTVARLKPGADRVRWVHGDARAATSLSHVDLATMTANVAQVFVDDDEWQATLGWIRGALAAGGRLVFETRDPGRRAWEHWTRAATQQIVDVPGVGEVESWIDLTDVALPLVTFQTSFVFHDDGTLLTSLSTLRFRERAEVLDSLAAAGFVTEDIRDAPDRPGREMVFVARNGPAVS